MIDTYGSILSVDSEPKFRKQIVDYLEDNGFSMLEASSKDEALAVFRQKKPDLVLSGLSISKDKFELIEVVKRESPETAVVVVSNRDDSDDIVEALRIGAWDFILKPLDNMAVLEHTVCRALERGRLVSENKKYRHELEKKNFQLSNSLMQLKEDQKAGRNLQQQLLPKSYAKFGNYTFSHRVIPSLYLSGDFVDYFEISKDLFGFYIADVSGHGASSAFVTVLIKSYIDQLRENHHIRRDNVIVNPDKVLKIISDNLLDAKLGKYLTMVFGVLDMKKNVLHYSIGGHYPNPILYDGENANYLLGGGFAVGIFKDAIFEKITYQLPEEFTLTMFSDGIFEIMEGKDLYEKENKILALMTNVKDGIKTLLNAFNVKNIENHPDDIALLLINRTKS